MTEAIQKLGACAEAAMELPIFRQNTQIARAPSYGGHPAWRMMPSRIATFRGSAAQCFCGIIALALATFVCLRLRADVATTAFIYLAVIVLLSLIGSYFASVVLTIIAVAALDYFFIQPTVSFAIDLPQDIALVIVFLLASLTVTGLIRRARKLTPAHQAQGIAKQAERELRLAINTIPALVWSALPDGSVDFVNQRWEEIGLSLDDLQGSKWINNHHPDERVEVVDRWRIAVETGTPYENITRIGRAGGEYRWFLVRAQPLRDEFGNIAKWYGILFDIEDQKRAEDALRESEQRFRDFTESASDWYWETGPDHRFITVSEHPDAIDTVPTRRIGTVRWDFARDLDEEPEKWRRHVADLDARKPFRDFRYRATSRDGSEVYIATSGKPLFDREGRFLGYRGVSSHITAAVRAALLEEALQEAKVVGDNIAHDLRTPLTRVRLRLERGREHAPTLEEYRAAADQAIAGLDQSLTTITALLRITEIEHSRRREGFGDVQLAPLIREAGDLYDPIAENKGVTLRVEAPDGTTVHGDRDLLFEAVANLVDNAVKFTPEGGRVEVALLHPEGGG